MVKKEKGISQPSKEEWHVCWFQSYKRKQKRGRGCGNKFYRFTV